MTLRALRLADMLRGQFAELGPGACLLGDAKSASHQALFSNAPSRTYH